jgi:peptidase C39-like protein
MKYIKQPDNYSCGPTAVINILKWLGKSASLADLPKIKRLCGTDITGTHDTYLTLGLVKSIRGIGTWEGAAPNIRNLRSHLKSGGAAIIGYFYYIRGEEHGHYVVCIKYTRAGNYVLLNEADHKSERQDRRPTRVRRTNRELIKMLHTRDGCGNKARVWLIDRRK